MTKIISLVLLLSLQFIIRTVVSLLLPTADGGIASCHALLLSLREASAIRDARRRRAAAPSRHGSSTVDAEAVVDRHRPSRHHEDSGVRRRILASIGGLVTAVPGATIRPRASLAAGPVTARDTDSLLALARRRILRPPPPKLLRRRLAQDFAVLLMRSSYNALDELDCVAMDQFQRDFFLIRSSEYETYAKAVGAGMVQQGDLTDPYYFDFISFAQYKTINRELTQGPPYVFEEMQLPSSGGGPTDDDDAAAGPAKFVPVIVRRDPSLTNAMLVSTHSSKVGAKILDQLEDTFRQSDARIPRVNRNSDAGE
jgi:hypothetical protein